VIAFIGVAIYALLTSRKGTPGRARTRARSRLLLLTFLLLPVVLGGVLVAAGLAGSQRHVAPRLARLVATRSQRLGSGGSSSFSVPSWVPWAMLGTLVGGALVVVVAVRTRARPPRRETLTTAVESAVTAALVDLDGVTDPRLAIIAAYERMEQTLAAAGLPRAAAEAPREYLGRVGGALQVDPRPLGTLTSLFEAAKFSVRRFDADARQRAVNALRALQSELA
jgi:uncharacterized protein DUF4129